MTSIVRDLRFAIRTLFQRPSVTITAIVALGLAIGSTTAIFSVVNAVLLKPLSFDDPDRVAIVWKSNPGRGLMYPNDIDVWSPLVIAGSTVRGAHNLQTIGRLKDGMSFQQSDAEMKTIAARLANEYPQTNKDWTIRVFNVHEWIVREMRPTLLVLLSSVGFVLLIACANVANLLLARGSDRMKEIAVRMSLGAARTRVLRQLLTENIVLALAGGVVGVLLAWVGLRALLSIAPTNLPRLSETELNLQVMLFTLTLSVLTGILFGTFPAMYILRRNLGEHLKDTTRGSTEGADRHRLRSLLVAAEIALTIVVTVGAGLMMQSLNRLHGVNPGFDPENVLTVQFNLPGAKYPPESFPGFVDRLLERIHSLPGVTSAATTTTLPLTGAGSTLIYGVDGKIPATIPEWPNAQIRWVSPGLFETLEIPFVQGRDFTAQDGNPAPVRCLESSAPSH